MRLGPAAGYLPPQMRRPWPLALVLLLLAATGASAASPNIVLVIGDDHGWPYYGFQPSPQELSNGENVQAVVQTPNLDALAATGLTFSRGYATDSVCSPSLQTLLSAHGLEWSQWLARRREVRAQAPIDAQGRLQRRENRYLYTLPRALGRAGYRTWEGGKLWAGLYSDAGFDEGLATWVDADRFYVSGGSLFGREGWNLSDCGSTATSRRPCPALDPFRAFLDGGSDQPFFAWFAPQLPHVPWDAPQEYRDDFEALGLQTPEVDHLSNVRWFDEVLGELLLELDRRGIREDTLIIYLSDNGWGLGFQEFPGTGQGKGTLYDIGFRTPVVFNQPGVVPAGARYDDFVSLRDIPATILDYAGAALPTDSMGESLRDRVHGGAPVDRDGLVMFSRTRGGAYVDDTWRYLQFNDGREELYRIDLDPFEQNDLAAANPEILARYANLVDARRWELAAQPHRAEVAGRLVRDDGSAIAGGTVLLRAGRELRTALSDAHGWFQFTGIERSQDLRLEGTRGTNAAAGDRSSIRIQPFTSPGLFVPIAALADRPVAGPFGAMLRGKILSRNGQPIAGARVRIVASLDGRDLSLRTVSQPDGRYEFPHLVPAPAYRITAQARGYRRVTRTGIAVEHSDDVMDVDLVLFPR